MPKKKKSRKSRRTYKRCEKQVAPNCTGLYNPTTAKRDGICNRCYQHIVDIER